MIAGDSYLVLQTEKNDAAKTYELHFWLGSKSSQVSLQLTVCNPLKGIAQLEVTTPSQIYSDLFETSPLCLLPEVKRNPEQPREQEREWPAQDESGAAAIFATELDIKLGGKAKQYRQVQDGESPEFLRASPSAQRRQPTCLQTMAQWSKAPFEGSDLT